MVKAAKSWVPDRQDVIWIDCNPLRGQEMRNVHPFLVLSPKAFNERTSRVIGLPMTTVACNADNPFAVAVGHGKRTQGRANQLRALPSAKIRRLAPVRRRAPHPMKHIPDARFAEVLAILNQIVQLA